MSKRPHDEKTVSSRASGSQNALAQHLLCPIRYELPLDPVIADDGMMYDRSAIEEWFAHTGGTRARSPLTNELISKRLTPSLQLRNMIRTMVQNNQFDEEMCEEWKKKLENEEKVTRMRSRADQGDTAAMLWMAKAHIFAWLGVRRDLKETYLWAQRAAYKGDPRAMALCGQCCCNGNGVVMRNNVQGVAWLARAAESGSEVACHMLGMAYLHGRHGLAIDPTLATLMLTKAKECTFRDSTVERRRDAARFLSTETTASESAR